MKIFTRHLFLIAAMTWSNFLAATESVEVKIKMKDLGFFGQTAFIAKATSRMVSLKSTAEDVKTSEKAMCTLFSADSIDEHALLEKRSDFDKSILEMIEGLSGLIALMKDTVEPESWDQFVDQKLAEAREKKDLDVEKEKVEVTQIPASFSAKQIQNIRDMKKRNEVERELIKEDAAKIKSIESFMSMMKTGQEEKQAEVLKTIVASLKKKMDLEIAEYREMRGYLSPKEMKTYFVLQEQIKDSLEKEKKKKAEKLKAEKELASKSASMP